MTTARRIENYANTMVSTLDGGYTVAELKEVAADVGANIKGIAKKIQIAKAIKAHCESLNGYENKDRDMKVKYLGYSYRGMADLIQVLKFEVTINGETKIHTVDSVDDKSLHSYISDAVISGKSVAEQYYIAIV